MASIKDDITNDNNLQSAISAMKQKIESHAEDSEITAINQSLTNLSENKQDKLTFDSAPESGSTNPVTSGGVYTEVGELKNDLETKYVGYRRYLTAEDDCFVLSPGAYGISGAANKKPSNMPSDFTTTANGYLIVLETETTTKVAFAIQAYAKRIWLRTGYEWVELAKTDAITSLITGYVSELENSINGINRFLSDDITDDYVTQGGGWVRKTWNDTHGFVNSNTRMSLVKPLLFNVPIRIISNIPNSYALTLRYFSGATASVTTHEGYENVLLGYGEAVYLPVGRYFTVTISKIGNAVFTDDDYSLITFDNGYVHYEKVTEEISTSLNDDLPKVYDGSCFLPDYYFANNYISGKVDEILINSKVEKGISFCFVTDIHLQANTFMSKYLLKYVLAHTSAPFVICGGDIVPNTSDVLGEEEKYLNIYAKEYLDYVKYIGKVFPVRGNHDFIIHSIQDGQSVNWLSMPQNYVYNYLSRNVEWQVATHPNKNYYYIDNQSQRVRIIILDEYETYGTTSVKNVLDNTQMQWLVDDALNVENYSIVVVSHQSFDSQQEYYDSVFSPVQSLMIAIKNKQTFEYDSFYKDYSNTTLDMICHISGHTHYDDYTVEDNLLTISTVCDTFYAYTDPNIQRTRGTVTECAFDVFSIDTAAKTIKTVRIGGGNNRGWNYSTGVILT